MKLLAVKKIVSQIPPAQEFQKLEPQKPLKVLFKRKVERQKGKREEKQALYTHAPIVKGRDKQE